MRSVPDHLTKNTVSSAELVLLLFCLRAFTEFNIVLVEEILGDASRVHSVGTLPRDKVTRLDDFDRCHTLKEGRSIKLELIELFG